MLHFKLGDRRAPAPDDPMGRDWVGYEPTTSPEELFERNRGIWLLGPRADRETHAVFSSTADGEVKFVAEINSLERYGKKRALVGRVLSPDDALHKRWVGRPSPDNFRNPVTYTKEPGKGPTTCACGCGESVPANRSFVPGHDQRAIHARINTEWGGTLAFIDWFDATYPDWRSGS